MNRIRGEKQRKKIKIGKKKTPKVSVASKEGWTYKIWDEEKAAESGQERHVRWWEKRVPTLPILLLLMFFSSADASICGARC
jgi:hypothetical protein